MLHPRILCRPSIRSPTTGRPKVIGQVNDRFIKEAKAQGQLTWHAHADEDERSSSCVDGCISSSRTTR